MDCKNALVEAKGDMEEAITILRKKGLASAQKKATRVAAEGMIGHYIHAGGKLGVLVEVNCETDFAARSEDFQTLVKDIAMHIAAVNPLYVRREDVPGEVLEKEKEIYKDQARASGKPEKIIDKIAEGKLESYYEMACLYDQKFVKDPNITREGPDQRPGWQGWREHSGSPFLAVQDRRRSRKAIHRSGRRSRSSIGRINHR